MPLWLIAVDTEAENSSNLLIKLPQEETNRLLTSINLTNISSLFQLTNQGRISVDALNAVQNWKSGSSLKFTFVVFKDVLTNLQETFANTYKGNSSDVDSLFKDSGISPLLTRESKSTLTYEVKVESAKELEILLSIISNGAIQAALILN